MKVTPQNFAKIIGFINDFLGDFLSVPPFPLTQLTQISSFWRIRMETASA